MNRVGNGIGNRDSGAATMETGQRRQRKRWQLTVAFDSGHEQWEQRCNQQLHLAVATNNGGGGNGSKAMMGGVGSVEHGG